MANAVSSTRLKPSASVRLSVRPSARTSQRGTGRLATAPSVHRPGREGARVASPPRARERQSARGAGSRQKSTHGSRVTQNRVQETVCFPSACPGNTGTNGGIKGTEERKAAERAIVGRETRRCLGRRGKRRREGSEVTPPRRGHPTPARSKELCQASPGRFSTSRFWTLPSGLLAWRR